jgi:hypothetical protein
VRYVHADERRRRRTTTRDDVSRDRRTPGIVRGFGPTRRDDAVDGDAYGTTNEDENKGA